MADFKPLDAQRAIRDDGDLRKPEKAMLWAAVLRTDNGSRKVRASLAMLAKDAGYQPNAATAVFAESNAAVMRYFEKVERQPRRNDLWFRPSDRLTGSDTHENRESLSEGAAVTSGVIETHVPRDPSAFTSAPSLLRPSAFDSSEPGGEQAQPRATPPGPPREEPAPVNSTAVAEEAAKPCGCPDGVSCPTCRGEVPVPSKYSEAKLKEFHDRRLGEEGLNEYGEPIGLDY